MMWWMVVFWLLLVPLVIAEIIIFVRTKKLSWLFFALSIFIYVIAVSYTLDVFDAGRNAVIITLVISAILMALVGRRLGRPATKRKTIDKKQLWAAVTILIIMVLIFIISAIFGRASEVVETVDSLRKDEIVQVYDRADEPRPVGRGEVSILTRTLSNDFILPVPIVRKEYKVCIETSQGLEETYPNERYIEQYPEVSPGSTESVEVRVMPLSVSQERYEDVQYSAVLVKEIEDYIPSCQDMGDPDYRIPIV